MYQNAPRSFQCRDATSIKLLNLALQSVVDRSVPPAAAPKATELAYTDAVGVSQNALYDLIISWLDSSASVDTELVAQGLKAFIFATAMECFLIMLIVASVWEKAGPHSGVYGVFSGDRSASDKQRVMLRLRYFMINRHVYREGNSWYFFVPLSGVDGREVDATDAKQIVDSWDLKPWKGGAVTNLDTFLLTPRGEVSMLDDWPEGNVRVYTLSAKHKRYIKRMAKSAGLGWK